MRKRVIYSKPSQFLTKDDIKGINKKREKDYKKGVLDEHKSGKLREVIKQQVNLLSRLDPEIGMDEFLDVMVPVDEV